jgi:voltage-gated potassium channel
VTTRLPRPHRLVSRERASSADPDPDAENSLGSGPDSERLGHRYRISLPLTPKGPVRQVARRLAMALFVLVLTTVVVYADRDGYQDNNSKDGDSLSLLDAAYYATVTLSTTGYGDITPSSDLARLVNILVVTPLRVLFLIILVGTTLEVLTERTREQLRLSRWRATLRDHTVIVGYGTKGRSAVETLLHQGLDKEHLVVVDPNPKVIEAANAEGLAGVIGDATRSEVLRRAEISKARQVVVATQRDDTAVLVTLTARQLNKGATIVVAVREEENLPLLRQSGASAVVASSSAAGRLLGMSMASPNVASVMEDLLTYGNGLDVVERPVTKPEVGRPARDSSDLVVAVIRGHRMINFDEPDADSLEPEDRVIAVRRAD